MMVMGYFLKYLGVSLAVFLWVASIVDMIEIMLEGNMNLKEFILPLFVFLEGSVFIGALVKESRFGFIIAYICFLFNSIFYFNGIFILAIFSDNFLKVIFNGGFNSMFSPPDVSALDFLESRKLLSSFFFSMGSIMAAVAMTASAHSKIVKKVIRNPSSIA